jgi:hypothetical protein
MDIGFDQKGWHNDWHPATAERAFAGGWNDAPEWLALHARLSAAWSARQELAADARGAALRCGSFDSVSARALTTFEHPSHAVNRIASGNRKPDGGNAVHQAGDSTSGGRG